MERKSAENMINRKEGTPTILAITYELTTDATVFQQGALPFRNANISFSKKGLKLTVLELRSLLIFRDFMFKNCH